MADVKRTADESSNRNVLLVERFRSERDLDRFVRSEIRYMKGFDMGAYRCAGLRLKFVLYAVSRVPSLVRDLSASYPELLFRLLVDAPGRSATPPGPARYHVYLAGRLLTADRRRALPDQPVDVETLRDHERVLPAEETLYETF